MNHFESNKNDIELNKNHIESNKIIKHPCVHCNKGFSTNSNMNKHKKTCLKKLKIKETHNVGKMKLIRSKTAPNIELDEHTANTICVSGSSKRGKSTLMVAIYNRYFANDHDLITILISPSCHIKLFDSLKNVYKINKFNKDTVQLMKSIKRIQNRTNNAYKFLYLIDDCVDLRYSKILDDAILTMRNCDISTIISIQYCRIISVQARSSLNQIICFAMNTDQSINNTLDSFFRSEFRDVTGIKNKEDLIREYRQITQKEYKGHSYLLYNVFNGELSHHLLEL